MVKNVIVGLQFGDEGKGNIGAYLARSGRGTDSDYDAIVRYHGGANAGESWDNNERMVISHQVPVCVGESDAYFASGGAIHVQKLVEELDYLHSEHMLEVTPDMFHISGRNNVVLLHHLMTEKKVEDGGVLRFASTKSGIAPAYADEARKVFINFAEFVGPNFPEILADRIHPQLRELYDGVLPVDEYLHVYEGIRERLAPYLVSEALMMKVLESANVLMAGCQSIGLDVRQGPTRLTSSSVTTRQPFDAKNRYGVMKLVQSEVGDRRWTSPGGRWITYDDRLTEELKGKTDDDGVEVGKTSGRSRGLGWLDAVLVKNNVAVGRVNKIAITKADRLWRVAEFLGSRYFPVCTSYNYKGSHLSNLPEDSQVVEECTPVYTDFNIGEDLLNPERLRKLQTFGELDQTSQDFFTRVEDLVGAEIDIISTGPLSRQKIVRD